MSFWNIPSIEPKLAYRWYISFGDRNIENGQTNNALPHWVCKKVTKPSYQIKHTEHKYLGVHRFNYPTHLEWQPITLTLVDVYNFDDKKFQFTKERKNIDPNKTDNFSVDNNTKNKTTIPELADQTITANRSTQLFFYYFLKEAGYIDPNEGIYQDLLARFTQTLTKRKMVGAFIGQNEDYFLEGKRSGDPNKTYIDQNTWNTLDINEINEFGQVTEKWKLFNPLITSVKFGELAYETDGVVDISIELVYDWAELVPSHADAYTKENYSPEYYNNSIPKIKDEINKEKKDKQEVFDEISRRKNTLEDILKNNFVKIGIKTAKEFQIGNEALNRIEQEKYSKIVLTADELDIYQKRLDVINSSLEQDKQTQEQIKNILSETSKQTDLSEQEQENFITNQNKKIADEVAKKKKENDDALKRSKTARQNVLELPYQTESTAEQSRKAEADYQATIEQTINYETEQASKSDLLKATLNSEEEKKKAEAIELSKRSVLPKKEATKPTIGVVTGAGSLYTPDASQKPATARIESQNSPLVTTISGKKISEEPELVVDPRTGIATRKKPQ